MQLIAGARKSPLSQAQFEEIKTALAQHHPHIKLTSYYVDTTGDIDQQTSLRALGKTDFFTKEIDALVLKGQCHLAIHSAKDLPDPLPPGLVIAALTKGVDPSDVLVMRKGFTIDSLPAGAHIATSSVRREEAVCSLRKDLTFIDVRGTIGQRLAKLETGEADGVVIAEAALIRLGLTHLNRVALPGPTVPLQGQLAVVVADKDMTIKGLFKCLDVR